jgi:hypothetical protein
VLFRPAAAMHESSPAVLRFNLAAVPGPVADGMAGIRVEIRKCRGRRPQSFLL